MFFGIKFILQRITNEKTGGKDSHTASLFPFALTNSASTHIIKPQLHTGELGVSRLRWCEVTCRTLEPDAGNADVGSQTKDAVGFSSRSVLSAFRMQISQNTTERNANTMRNQSLRCLTEGAIFLALAIVLNSLKLFHLPNGGSVDLAMLPIFIYALRWGVRPGLLVGFLFGLLQMLIDSAVAWGWQSLILDYLLAFTPLGLAGLFRGRGRGIYAGVILGATLRFVIHYISGVTIYAILAPTALFGYTFTSPVFYSLVYNGSYMLINTVFCLVILTILNRPLHRYLQAEDLVAAHA